jgi:hypothetical protein
VSAVILAFPTAAHALKESDHAAIAREARIAARVVGCNVAQAAMVGAHAEGLLRRGLQRTDVLAKARTFALDLLDDRDPPPARCA